MAGIADNLYSMFISSIVGKTEGYGAKMTYNHDLPYYKTIPVGREGSYSYSNHELTEASVLEQASASFLTKNKEVYAGLLAEEPIWHHGPARYNNHPTENPAINTQQVSGYSFLEVQEIPNGPRNGYFKLASTEGATPEKYFDGFYWSSYKRMPIYKRLPKLNCKLDTTTNPKAAVYSGVSSEYAVDILKYVSEKSTVKTSPTTFDQQFSIYLTNPNAIYMGENTDAISWPATKYFGLFNTLNQPTNMIATNDETPIHYMEDENLHFWGAFEENDNWYHQWDYSSAEWSLICYDLWYKVNGIWTRNTSATYDSSKIYYKKLGIIVGVKQGGVFSKDKFQIKWNSDIISNKFT